MTAAPLCNQSPPLESDTLSDRPLLGKNHQRSNLCWYWRCSIPSRRLRRARGTHRYPADTPTDTQTLSPHTRIQNAEHTTHGHTPTHCHSFIHSSFIYLSERFWMIHSGRGSEKRLRVEPIAATRAGVVLWLVGRMDYVVLPYCCACPQACRMVSAFGSSDPTPLRLFVLRVSRALTSHCVVGVTRDVTNKPSRLTRGTRGAAPTMRSSALVFLALGLVDAAQEDTLDLLWPSPLLKVSAAHPGSHAHSPALVHSAVVHACA